MRNCFAKKGILIVVDSPQWLPTVGFCRALASLKQSDLTHTKDPEFYNDKLYILQHQLLRQRVKKKTLQFLLHKIKAKIKMHVGIKVNINMKPIQIICRLMKILFMFSFISLC